MENQELFKQAILDAKAVRETAMAAAKATLAEHFEPFIKETMEKSLEEEEGMEMEAKDMHTEDTSMLSEYEVIYVVRNGKCYRKDDEGNMDEVSMSKCKMHAESMHEEGMDTLDEASLDEILAELDALSNEGLEEGEDLEEGHVKSDGYDGKGGKGSTGYDEKAKASHGDHKLHEAEDDDAEEGGDDDSEKAGEETEKPEGPDEQEVVDITVGELKDIIRDVFMQLQGGESMEAPLDADTDMAADLESGEEEISLDEILAELEKEEDDKKVEEGTGPGGTIDPQASDVQKTQYSEMKKELNEAVKTIKALKNELNEINLFSAKLLYVNKIFKAKNLSEAQKTKVINAFDRAESVKEVQNTYKTLLESVSAGNKKSSIKESIGFASKPLGNAPARPIVEADAFVSRWQTLAGIK